MQYSLTFLVAALAATAVALPAVRDVDADVEVDERSIFSDIGNDISTGVNDAENAVNNLGHKLGPNCQLVQCATALGPTAVGCGVAAAQEFLDPISDISCIAAALNTLTNKPAACSGCKP